MTEKQKIMNETEKLELLKLLMNESVQKAYLYDNSLIERKMEQATVARIFFYMQEALKYDNRFAELSRLNLDSEYGKNGNNLKSTAHFTNGTRPDILLHSRGNNEANTVIIEFKSRENPDVKRDVSKLKDFTSQIGEFKYSLGAQVNLGKQRPKFIYFQNGEIINGK